MNKNDLREQNDFRRDGKSTGSQLELTSLMAEYENQFDRSNKIDNKVYIAITFCGFLFVFIIGLFSGISKLKMPENGIGIVISGLYILSCIAVMGAYVYALVFFMGLLRPEQIARMDPEIMQREHLENMGEEQARLCLIALYRETINGNLDRLHHRCDEFVRGLRFILWTVILAFVCYAFQILLNMM
ncbi:hypothetical protein [Brotaphodocola sp.]|uniref:hypothetical protein n=1 Tax=Brotaphodocola sp. TaxID=3073577 RepID=UPI003D7EA73C